MADSPVEFVNPNTGDIREMIVEKVVTAHNVAVEAVIEFKEQGDVDELADEILSKTEPVRPTAEQAAAAKTDPAAFSLENYKFMVAHLKSELDKATENLKNGAMEMAKAGISADYDIDKGRAKIKDLRADWAQNYTAAVSMLKMVGSIVEVSETDSDGKTSTELEAADNFGTILLKVGSVPSVRAKRGDGNSSSNSEGAKIRAWGKEQGKWADLSDRGPLPADLKEAYAEAHAA